MNADFLLDKDFLMRLQSIHHREIFARITTLSWDELPLEYVEGKITNGNLNIEGNSAVRRTCSLSMVAKDVNLSNFHWGMHTKIRLEIGLTNDIDNRYPTICWFNEGLYIITGLSISSSPNSFTININGKDKMCLINGEVGGKLPHSIDWGIEDYTEIVRKEDGTVDLDRTLHFHNHIPIKTIIREAIQNYGNELAQNIIINDIEDYGIEMIDYKGEPTMYLIQERDTNIFINMTLNANQKCWVNGTQTVISDETRISYQYNIENSLFTSTGVTPTAVAFTQNGEAKYYISKMTYGNAIGYRQVDLTYAGDLITNVGDTLINLLDKIKSMLGDFEYFYNVDGKFVFQKKPIYIDHTWNSLEGQGESTTGQDDTISPGGILEIVAMQQDDIDITYCFNDSNLITSFANNPDLLRVRNDYIIWGKRTTLQGVELPIHLRYAIDHKPELYYSLQDQQWYASLTAEIPNSLQSNIKQYDWRELIYKMARDYRSYGVVIGQSTDILTGYHNDDFLYEVAQQNRYIDNDGNLVILFPEGKTGYEQYYTDLIEGSGPYGEEQGFWRYLYDPDRPTDKYREDYWSIVVEEPETLLFWFDFLEAVDSDLEKYSVQAIGDRTSAINDDKVKAIFYRETPNIIFTQTGDEEKERQPGYTYVQLPDHLQNMFSITRRGKDAITALDEQLYEYSYCAENISISALPVYHLVPNTRIQVKDENSGIDGEYIISRISLSLTHNGIMSISAVKAIDTLQ